ncbi:hypothetical protein ACFLWZ_02865 [Chloroflexota bacterium]
MPTSRQPSGTKKNLQFKVGGYSIEAHSDWHNRIVKEISPYQDSLGKKESKKYKIDLLLRIARRIDDFSPECGNCQLFQQEITKLVQDFGIMLQTPNPGKEERKRYSKAINNIVSHLQKEHHLVSDGQNMGIWMAIGVGIGTAIGVALETTSVGTALGVGIGLGVGSYMDKKAKREGKVI